MEKTMHGRIKKPFKLSRSIRLTQAEDQILQAAAKAAGLPVAEYIRTQALEAATVNGQTKLILSEVGTTRRLVLGLFKLVLDKQELSEPLIRELIDRTEATSEAWLEKRLLQIRKRVQ